MNIVFLGSSMYHKEWGYRAVLISWLKETYKSRFAHYGRGGKGGYENNDEELKNKPKYRDWIEKHFYINETPVPFGQIAITCRYCGGEGYFYQMEYHPSWGGSEWDEPCRDCEEFGVVLVTYYEYLMREVPYQIRKLKRKLFKKLKRKLFKEDEINLEDIPF